MNKFQIKVGSKIPSELLVGQSEFINWVDFSKGQKVVFIGSPNIQPLELLLFQQGSLEIGMFKHKEIMVVSHNIIPNKKTPFLPRLDSIKNECCYHPFISDTVIEHDFKAEYELVKTNQIKQYDLIYVLFDTNSKYICAIRKFNLSRHFSIQLSKTLFEIGMNNVPGEVFMERVEEIHKHDRDTVFGFCTTREIIE